MRFLVVMVVAVCCVVAPGVPARAVAQAGVAAAASDAVVLRWAGSYVFEDALGEIPAGSGTRVSITYKLRIPGSASQPVTLDADGFQTEDRLRCTISGSGERIEVRFVSFADGSVKNQFGVSVYQPNDVLFTLERAKLHGSQVVLTEWKALKPDKVSKVRGRYFVPARSQTHARKGE